MAEGRAIEEIVEAGLERAGVAPAKARLAPCAWSFRDRHVGVTVAHEAEAGLLRVSATLLRIPGPPAQLLPIYRRLLEWNATTRSARCAAQDDLLVLVSGRSTEGLDVEEVASIVTEVRDLAAEYATRLLEEFPAPTEVLRR